SHRQLHTFPTRRTYDLGRTESSPRSRAQYEGRGRGEDRKRCIVQGCGLRQPNPSNDATQDYPEFRPEAPWFCLRFFPASSPAHRSEEHTSELQSRENLV